jgi:hypothetical protein
MSEDDAAEPWDRDVESVGRGVLVGDREEVQRRRRFGREVALNCGKLGRLMLERVEPVLVAKENLQRHQRQQQPQRDGEHHPPFLGEPALADQPRAHAQHDEAGGDVSGADHMREAVGKGRVEDDCEPVHWNKSAIGSRYCSTSAATRYGISADNRATEHAREGCS